MPAIRRSLDDVRREARVNRRIVDETTEADIARQAAEDDTDTTGLDLTAMVRNGRARRVTAANPQNRKSTKPAA